MAPAHLPRGCGSYSAGPRWYVFQSKPRAETTAAQQLERQGFESYVPMVARQIRIGTLISPLFPAYGFVRLDLELQRWRAVHSTLGVRRLFSSAPEAPVPVPPGLVEEIRAGEAARLVAADLRPAFLRAGASVRVVGGPFVGASGLCLIGGRERVRILLDIMGRRAAVEMPRGQVEAD